MASGSRHPLLCSGAARHPGTGRWPRSGQELARPALIQAGRLFAQGRPLSCSCPLSPVWGHDDLVSRSPPHPCPNTVQHEAPLQGLARCDGEAGPRAMPLRPLVPALGFAGAAMSSLGQTGPHNLQRPLRSLFPWKPVLPFPPPSGRTRTEQPRGPGAQLLTSTQSSQPPPTQRPEGGRCWAVT